MSVFCCFFSGTASYSRGYTGQKFAFTTSLSWHRLGPWLHPFWLHCSQQFYRVPNIKAVFVPSGLIHGWGVHFGLYCRRRLVVTMSLLKFEAIHLHYLFPKRSFEPLPYGRLPQLFWLLYRSRARGRSGASTTFLRRSLFNLTLNQACEWLQVLSPSQFSSTSPTSRKPS